MMIRVELPDPVVDVLWLQYLKELGSTKPPTNITKEIVASATMLVLATERAKEGV